MLVSMTNNLGDELLRVATRLSRSLEPVTRLLDGIVEHLAPRIVAQATCPPSFGYSLCGYQCGACCANCGGDYKNIKTIYWAYSSCATQQHQSCDTCDYC